MMAPEAARGGAGRPGAAPPGARAVAAALDLGSTRFKAALLHADGALGAILSEPAPALAGRDPIREGDPEEAFARADRLLERMARRRGAKRSRGPAMLPLGIASQRSSFLLWDRRSGRPATPFVSWQDRRPLAWCRARAAADARLRRETGLRLSPHYAGPKVAFLLSRDPALRQRAAKGELLFGTLETYLLWRWTGGALHATDLTMAARTLLADPRAGGWSPRLLRFFGIPAPLMPRLLPTAGRNHPLPRGFLAAATVADQAAGLLAATGDDPRCVLVNLGTGCFVLRPTGTAWRPRPGYLAGPILASERARRYALEGTVNGGGAVADRFAPPPTPLPAADPAPEAFCLPDSAGVGAPHWRAGGGFALSEAARRLSGHAARRTVLEGLLFRIREILEGIGAPRNTRLLLAGGLAEDPFVPAALAAALGRPVEVLEEPEATLLGAARLAAGLPPKAARRARRVRAGTAGAYLRPKYRRWRAWAARLLDSPGFS